MEQSTFVKLDRCFDLWRYRDNPIIVTVFIKLLTSVNIKPRYYDEILVDRGECVISTLRTCAELGISRQQLRTALEKMQKSSTISVKGYARYSVVRLLNFDRYQAGYSCLQPRNNHSESLMYQGFDDSLAQDNNHEISCCQADANLSLTTPKECKKERMKECNNKEGVGNYYNNYSDSRELVPAPSYVRRDKNTDAAAGGCGTHTFTDSLKKSGDIYKMNAAQTSAEQQPKCGEGKALKAEGSAAAKLFAGEENTAAAENDMKITRSYGLNTALADKNGAAREVFGEFKNVLLSKSESEELKRRYPQDFNEATQKLSSYMERMGKTYNSHYAVLLKWLYEDTRQKSQKQSYTYAAGRIWESASPPSYDIERAERRSNTMIPKFKKRTAV